MVHEFILYSNYFKNHELYCLLLYSIGPACVLFEKPYYELMSKALRAGGIIASQGSVNITCAIHQLI